MSCDVSIGAEPTFALHVATVSEEIFSDVLTAFTGGFSFRCKRRKPAGRVGGRGAHIHPDGDLAGPVGGHRGAGGRHH